MIAGDLIQTQTPILHLSDSTSTALNFFDDYKLFQIPVFGEDGFIGLLDEDTVLDSKECKNMLHLKPLLTKHKINEEEHLYNALNYFLKHKLCILPVVDTNQKYMGCIGANDLFKKTCEWLSVDELGGLIHLEIEQQNYSLSQIAQIIESNGAKIISCVCIPKKDNPTISEVIIKLNQEELSSIIHTFERYEYKIIASHHKNIHQKGLDDRYNSFIRYLNV